MILGTLQVFHRKLCKSWKKKTRKLHLTDLVLALCAIFLLKENREHDTLFQKELKNMIFETYEIVTV